MARILILLTCAAFARDLDKLFSKSEFKVGSGKFTAYVADDEAKRERGLMFVEKMPDDVGMLFIFEEERPLGFWMKNTLIPLQIAFLDHKGKVVDIQEMEPAKSSMARQVPTYHSKEDAQFALEMNTGWFTRHKIKNGDVLKLTGKTNSALLKKALPK